MRAFFLLVSLVCCLSSCAPNAAVPLPSPSANPEYPAGKHPLELDQTSWQLEKMLVEGEEPIEVPESANITLTFKNGGISGQLLCNTYGGPIDQVYNNFNGNIVFPRTYTTVLGCPGSGDLELKYRQVLDQIVRYTLENERLSLSSGNGSQLVFRRLSESSK